jgi:DNA-binding transcriptional ArsR family regulator
VATELASIPDVGGAAASASHAENDVHDAQVSQHLTVLKAVGLVEAEPRAQQRLYRLRAQPVKQLHKWLDRYRCIWEERFEQLDELIEEIKRKEKSDAAGKR